MNSDNLQHHFTAHYDQNRNVYIFTGAKDNMINLTWFLIRYQEEYEYFDSLFIANFDIISTAIKKVIKNNSDYNTLGRD